MTNLHETYVAELGSNSRLLDRYDAERTALLGADLKTDQTDDNFCLETTKIRCKIHCNNYYFPVRNIFRDVWWKCQPILTSYAKFAGQALLG